MVPVAVRQLWLVLIKLVALLTIPVMLQEQLPTELTRGRPSVAVVSWELSWGLVWEPELALQKGWMLLRKINKTAIWTLEVLKLNVKMHINSHQIM